MRMGVREYIASLFQVVNGCSFLDLGCGNGQDLKYYKDYLVRGPFDSFIGVDKIERSIATAKTDFSADGLKFFIMDAAEGLKFPDQTFDIVHSMNVVECISDKRKLVSEIYRVLKPGGQIVCAHCDWASIVYNGRNKDLVSSVVKKYGEWKQPWMDEADSWMGRRIWGMFHSTGLFQGEIHLYNLIETEYAEGKSGWNMVREFQFLVGAGEISQNEFDLFCADQETLAAEGEYIYVRPVYIYSGRKIERGSQ